MTIRHSSKRSIEPEAPKITMAEVFRQRLRDNPPDQHPVWGGGAEATPLKLPIV